MSGSFYKKNLFFYNNPKNNFAKSPGLKVLMNETHRKLEEKYRRAVYAVITETDEIRFRVGELSLNLDALLAVYNAVNFAFITAYNPRSKVLSAAQNELRHAELEKLLIAESFRFLTGYGTDKDEKWGREMSLLIMNISKEKAREIARKFEQNAIVCGEKNQETKLVWCSDG